MAADGAEPDRLGCSLSMGSDYIIVGAAGNYDNGMYAGAAYVWDISSF
jgi:hypothetical protein